MQLRTHGLAAAFGLTLILAAPVQAALNATVYEGWMLDPGTGDIVESGLPVIGTFEDAQVDHWDGTNGYRWMPFGRDDLYTAVWVGALDIPTTGNYGFRTTSDDGVQFYLDGQTIISSTGQQWFGVHTATAELDAGTHALRLAMYENFGNDGIRLEWQAPGSETWEVIPASALSAVPEPSTAVSAALGMAWMAHHLRLRRRRQPPGV